MSRWWGRYWWLPYMRLRGWIALLVGFWRGVDILAEVGGLERGREGKGD